MPGDSSGLGPLLCATVVTADLDPHARVYEQAFGWIALSEHVVDTVLAETWAAPEQAGARARLLGPAQGGRGSVRLVEGAGSPAHDDPLRRPGWRAIEICVTDVREVRAGIDDSPFTVVGEPAPIPGNETIEAMQVLGPGGEMLYLTEIGPQSVYELPVARHLVDHVFIGVLSAPSLPDARAFYESHWGAAGPPGTIAAPVQCINRVLDLPLEREHEFCALQLAGRTLVEIDGHPPELPGVAPLTRALPAGTAMMTFSVDSLARPGIEAVGRPVAPDAAPYDGRPTATIRGPAGERIELVERG